MILNQQRRVRVSISGLEKFLAAARKRLRLPPRSLTVALVSDAQIARWNRAYRGKNRPTDVLSFPADGSQAEPATSRKQHQPRPARGTRARRHSAARAAAASAAAPENLPGYLGDIAIAPAVARRNALRLGRAFDHEMRILILHGILHLLGYDHETDSGEMDRRENRLRRELGLC
ncbi:MAG TPA: rRNA maturation RNase YbeY [Candidatus Acidoferrales bacterium]|jgi:probable rRNA maturation factor|nr:rRNA maturation RNase YbeY [Candidatus Acidoferrales bacterium]